MSETLPELEFARCLTCHHRFVPLDGVCPRCASSLLEPLRLPPLGSVLASTEVVYPSEGWPAPHRLCLVEVAEAVRLLAVAPEGPLPVPGELVAIHLGPGYYRLEREPTHGG